MFGSGCSPTPASASMDLPPPPQQPLPASVWPDLAPPERAARHRFRGPGTPRTCCPSPLSWTWHPPNVLPVTAFVDLAPPERAARHRFRGPGTPRTCCLPALPWRRPQRQALHERECLPPRCARATSRRGHSGSMRGQRSVPGSWRPHETSPHRLRRCVSAPSTDWTCSAQEQRVAAWLSGGADAPWGRLDMQRAGTTRGPDAAGLPTTPRRCFATSSKTPAAHRCRKRRRPQGSQCTSRHGRARAPWAHRTDRRKGDRPGPEKLKAMLRLCLPSYDRKYHNDHRPQGAPYKRRRDRAHVELRLPRACRNDEATPTRARGSSPSR
jgi:hypothetical protein